MKKKLILILSIFFTTMILTGCTQYIKDDNKNIAKNEVTGQNLVENILCQPEDITTIEAYKKYNMEFKSIPKCSEFKITSGGYEGIWNTIFVKPLAKIILIIKGIVKNSGLAIILVTILIRTVMVPFTKQASLHSKNLKKVLDGEINKNGIYETKISNIKKFDATKLDELSIDKSLVSDAIIVNKQKGILAKYPSLLNYILFILLGLVLYLIFKIGRAHV